ncbi:DUF1127 domain-containing protein [Salinicola avicenniae]|uniref:DUF1127 domain-containing protein n=1 Tax=Salinicola avicenniae TaxID=2916836 RepID=UPI002072C5A9|nr:MULTISPECIES: DUF1127 domain-containing protein [unclassified Salinicola]
MTTAFLQNIRRLFANARQRRRDFTALSHLSDHALKDIGLRRDFGDISPLNDADNTARFREAKTSLRGRKPADSVERAAEAVSDRPAFAPGEREGSIAEITVVETVVETTVAESSAVESPLREPADASDTVNACPCCGARLA